jgi:hypothetical protein
MRYGIGITRRVCHRDHPPVAGPQTHDLLKTEILPESLEIFYVLIQGVFLWIADRGSTVSSKIIIDELRGVRQRGIAQSKVGVICSGAPMGKNYNGPLFRSAGRRHQPNALDIKV